MNWEVRTMRSGTSCFNSTLYRKTMLRFWPLWAAYGLMWLFMVPFNLLNNYFSMGGGSVNPAERTQFLVETARDIPRTLQFGVFVACGYGVLCAMAVFGYLYNSRSACMMHALPLRRETLFTTQYLAGLSFALLPNLVVAGITLAAELPLVPQNNWGTCLASLGIWLLAQSGVGLFFFSFASFCAMFTGHILALPAFYGILNLLVYVLDALIRRLLNDFFFGFSVYYGGDVVRLPEIFTPIWSLSGATSWEVGSATVDGVTQTINAYFLQNPGMVAAYAAAGVVLAVLALLVYRQRQVESAGDVVSVRLVRPIFKYGVAFCSGLCLGMFTTSFFGWRSRLALAVCVVVWAVIGCFVAQMLLSKSFRVLKYWKGAAASCVVMILLCAACFTDVLGVTAWVPQANEVVSVTADCRLNYPYDSGDSTLYQVTDPGQIEKIVALHQAIVDHRDIVDSSSSRYQPGDDYTYLEVVYTLTDGSMVERRYADIPIQKSDLNQEGTVTWAVSQIAQDRDMVAEMYRFDQYEQYRLVEAYLDRAGTQSGQTDLDTSQPHYLEGASNAQLKELWQAMRTDFDAGTIGVRYLFDDEERLENTYVTDLVFVFEMPTSSGTSRPSDSPASESRTTEMRITLSPNAANTLAWLTQYAGWGTTVFPMLHG